MIKANHALSNSAQITSDLLASRVDITAGQRTMSGLIVDLTGQTLVWLVILTGHFWIRTFYNIFLKLSLNAFCSITL